MNRGVKKEESIIGKIISVTFLILNIILGIFGLIMVILAFFVYSAYLSGFLYFALTIFLFIPRKVLIIPNWSKFLIAIFIFIAILFLNMALYWPEQSPILIHEFGEEFVLESSTNISMIIYNATLENSVLIGGQEKNTAGSFILVNCGMTNVGDNSITINPGYDIIDNQNKTYAGIEFSAGAEIFQPNLQKKASFIFEVPNTIKNITFRISDDKKIHLVPLGI